MEILILTIVFVAVIMAIMAIGLVFRGRCLRGSCGGNPVLGPDGEEITCATCPRRQEQDEDDTVQTPHSS
jgi:hypothetical protein